MQFVEGLMVVFDEGCMLVTQRLEFGLKLFNGRVRRCQCLSGDVSFRFGVGFRLLMTLNLVYVLLIHYILPDVYISLEHQASFVQASYLQP
ncbi:hypothetical protein M3J09_002315 [Ascochyta lentis]